MLEKLLDALEAIKDRVLPVREIKDYERGVLLRFGRFRKELSPGLHMLWPGIDFVAVDRIVPRTANLPTQTLITKDGKQINISVVVTARIQNIKKALLEVEDADAALRDACYGAVGELVAASNFDDIRDAEFSERLRKASQKQAVSFGWSIDRLYVGDLCLARALRLFGVNERTNGSSDE
jgi:regulator of protease activity HflC (stomatin/prohibitin superfamily)